MPVHPALLPLLVCPLDHAPLHIDGNTLVSQSGWIYPVVDDTIPVMIIPGIEQTFDVVTRSRNEADEACLRDGVIDTSIWEGWDKKDTNGLHPFVSKMVGATCGYMYQNMVGHLVEYPIPTLRLPPAAGKSFLELGCNWGRWCIAAHRLGYQAFGLDPVLEAIHAAYSVARQLNADCRYVVGDARHLPFPDATFDVVFSYSVLQHFTRSDVLTTLSEVKRVLKPGGRCLIQMANTYGLRCLYHQARRGFREPTVPFDVRYWTPGKLKKTFTEKIGPTQLFVDGYFNLNPQPSASKLLPWRYRTIVRTSETLRALAKYIKPLTWAADSLYLSSVKKDQ